jgi:hypothetical protein
MTLAPKLGFGVHEPIRKHDKSGFDFSISAKILFTENVRQNR